MKMPDGGFRPAYNAQLASDPDTQVIVAVDIDTTGSDHGVIGPMQDQIRTSYGQAPKQYELSRCDVVSSEAIFTGY